MRSPERGAPGKMDDVILAGTSNKSALGRAKCRSTTTAEPSGRVQRGQDHPHAVPQRRFEHSINGVPCRLLDITELLSDGGVGRQQHVIVSQIDAVLNARPEDRRSIIEEAAGVLKYRKRKDRAERRLTATDGDLTRVKDLMREVRRGLRPLEKQAEAARRHGDLIAELTALRIHLAGREVAELRTKLATNGEFRASTVEEERATRAELDELAQSVSVDERALADHGMTSATPWFDWSRCESGPEALRRSSPNASAASNETARRSPIGRSSPTSKPRQRSAEVNSRRSLLNSRRSPLTEPDSVSRKQRSPPIGKPSERSGAMGSRSRAARHQRSEANSVHSEHRSSAAMLSPSASN